MKTSLEDINPFRKFAMVLSRFNLLLPRLKAPCGASYPWEFRPNLMGNFSLTADSDSRFFFVVLPRHVLWSVQETRAILSTNQITNLEPSAPGHSYFPALQTVCLCWRSNCITIFPTVINWVSKNRNKSYHNLLPIRTNVTIIIVQ